MDISYSRNREKKFGKADERNFETTKHPPDIASQPKEKTNQLEDVVFSGLSCRLPESANNTEFRDNLMNGVDMVTEDNRRWEPGLYDLPRGNGKLKDITKFDNEFFGDNPKQAKVMDPQVRILHEVAYEALVDAGQCPELLRGSNIGVFIGVSMSECHEAWSKDPETVSGYTMTGCYNSMFANRLSYFFDFKGPSFTVDSACSSSFVALHNALQSIRSGKCDAALVGGSNLCLKPSNSLQFQKLGMLATDGRCKPFDAKADGYCRSEAVVAVFLQKAKDAKRIYCHVVNTGTNNDGYKPEGITHPSCEKQLNLLEFVYGEAGLDPSVVTYVETHGTGTQVGDYEETKALAEFFCRNRPEPLPIGSTKSNMGHCEAVSGLASIAKVIIAMEEGVIPGNLHFHEPNPNLPELRNGKLKVVSKNIEWKGGVVGINSFGFGGSNCHVILKSYDSMSIETCPNKDKKLFCGVSRSEEGIKKILGHAEQESTDDQFLTFLSETISSQTDVPMYRGFKVLNSSTDMDSIAVCKIHDKRPVWYVFTGMGCQWPGMGCQMMSMDVFRKSILKCEAAVFPYGIKLSKMLTSRDESMYEDVINAFVAITAIQVALVDLLRCVGVEPDGFIGHSIGEIGCAYADRCFSAEEAVLVAYWRGRCIKKAMLPPGAMAVVGLTWEEVSKACPDGVVPACHNAVDSVTVSGPKQAVEDFVEDLRKKDVFAKEVNSVGIAFHSYFMKTVETSLYEMFSKVIKHRRERSAKWISTSVKQGNLDTDLAKYSGPEYHVNNILSPVLFHEALQHVPDNAILIEIAPHCLLRAILKRSLSKDCYITGLMQRSNDDNVQFCLSNMGNMFLQGAFLSPHLLLQPARYPLKHGTPMIAPLNTWKHDAIWKVPSPDVFVQSSDMKRKSFCYEIDTSKGSKFNYLSGHKIDGRVLFPAAGYLWLAWKSFMKLRGQPSKDVPIAFENIRFHRVTVLSETVKEKFDVVVTAGTGLFELTEAGSVVASGRILELNSPRNYITKHNDKIPSNMVMSSNDVYKELRLRGYEYEGVFQGIVQTDLDCKTGLVRWSGNFVTFVDSMLHMITLSKCGRDLRLPTSVESITVDPTYLTKRLKDEEVGIEVNTNTMQCIAGGVEIKGLVLSIIPRRKDDKQPMIQTCKLLPHDRAIHISVGTFELQYTNLCMHLASKILTSLSSYSQRNTITALLTDMKMDVSLTGQLSEDIPEKYSGEGFTLLRAFRTFLEVKNTQVNHLAEVYIQHRHAFKRAFIDDIILSAKRAPEILKALIETVLENSGDNINVLELGTANMKEEIEKHLSECGNVTYSYGVLEKSSSRTTNNLSSNVTPKTDLIVVDNMLHVQRDLQAFLQDIVNLLDDTGFVLLKETTQNFLLQYTINGFQEQDLGNSEHENRKYGLFFTVEMLKQAFKTMGLLCIHEVHHPLLYSVFLLRKQICADSKESKIIDVSGLDCKWLDDLKESLADVKETQNRYIWLYADNCFSGLIGMAKCLMKEQGGHKIRCVLNKTQKNEMAKEEMVNMLMERNLAFNIVTDDGLASYRFASLAQEMESRRSSGYSYLNIVTYGDLSSLTWFQTCPEKFRQSASHEICKVEIASLNFRDLMLASGKLNPDAIPKTGINGQNNCLLGIEFSGTDSDGNRVMGIVPSKGFATHVDAHKDFLWMVRDDWSFADAASVPVAYSTAFYALVVRGRLVQGQTVLIHSGSGGVGQAAIRIAKSLNCEIFTTVGTEQKRAYLLSVFPELKPENIFSSRDTAFEMEIMDATSGKGVDLVLNSLSGKKLMSSLKVVANHGCFLEIGKFDLFNDTELGMAIFLKNISFHGILLDSLFENGNREWKKVYQLVEEGIKSGVVMPLNTTIYEIRETEAAFRYMGKGNHIGKILIQIGDYASPENVQVVPRIVCDSKKSYVIIGGLGGFGLELAGWLAIRGARSITLTSRSGVTNGYQARQINLLKSMGVDVVVSRKNAGNIQEAEDIVKASTKPCGGIFNTAMVLEDGLIENQTVERFQRVIEPKLRAAINLDKVTRQLCKKTCEWFVMFSSVSSGRGNAGQSNYGFANSGMERLCEERTRDGLHGLAIQWGVIGDVGFVFEKQGNNKTEIAGVVPQSIRSCLDTLEIFMTQSAPVVTSFVQAGKWSTVKNRFSEEQKDSLLTKVCNIIGINDYSKVDTRSPLENLGVDSLMTVEIKQSIDRMTDFRFSIDEIRRLTMQDIQDIDTKCFQMKLKLDTKIDANGSVFTLKDILVPTDVILPLNNSKENGEPLYIIHMIEGTTEMLRHVSSFIERPVFGVQCTEDVPINTVTDMAKYYIQVILEHNQDQNFHLAGYSFGGMLALEIGYQLKNSERTSHKLLSMALLDGTPLSVAASIRIFHKNFGIKDENSRKTMSLAILGSLLLQQDIEKTWESLNVFLAFEERVDNILTRLADKEVIVSRKNWIQAVERYNQRNSIARSYEFPGTYRGDVMLITPEHWTVERDTLGPDQGLKRVVDGSVKVYSVPGRHLSFLHGSSGEQVAKYIDENIKASSTNIEKKFTTQSKQRQ